MWHTNTRENENNCLYRATITVYIAQITIQCQFGARRQPASGAPEIHNTIQLAVDARHLSKKYNFEIINSRKDRNFLQQQYLQCTERRVVCTAIQVRLLGIMLMHICGQAERNDKTCGLVEASRLTELVYWILIIRALVTYGGMR